MRTIDFFPVPFSIGVLMLAVLLFYFRRRTLAYRTGMALFGLYLLAAIGMLFFPLPIPEQWPANLTLQDTRRSLASINWIPFNYDVFTYPGSLRIMLRDVFANILLTIPFGFGICFLRPLQTKQVFLVALATGLALEGTQLALKLVLGVYPHSVDITDVLLNAFGVILGAGFFGVIQLVFQGSRPHA